LMTKDKFIEWLNGYLEFAQTLQSGLTHVQLEVVLDKMLALNGEAPRPVPFEDDDDSEETPIVPEELRHNVAPPGKGRLVRG
jgi:hypothetical protein